MEVYRLHRIALKLAFSLCALAGAATSLAADVTADAELMLINSDDHSISLIVPGPGKIPLIFHYTGVEAASFDLDIDTFLSASSLQAGVSIGTPGNSHYSAMEQLVFERGEHRKELELSTADLVPGVEYNGKLTATAPATEPKMWTVKLQRPAPRAELVADVNRAELDIAINPVLGYFGIPPHPTRFLITLREKTGKVPVTGIMLSRAPGSEFHEDFDLASDLNFYLDGVEAEDLARWDPNQTALVAGLRDIPPGGQRTLEVEIGDLPRGDYKLVFRIGAANGSQDSEPTIELDIHVRHALAMPLAVLLLAIAVSFLLTKGTVNWRQRLKLQELARALDREWLREIRDMAPTVWLKATRRQALMTLDRFFLLPAPQELVQRLETAMMLLKLLRRYLDVRRDIESRGFQYMLSYRIENELNAILAKIEPEQLDAATMAALMTEFDGLEQSLENPEGRYRPYVRKAQRRVKGSIVVEKLTMIEPAHQEKLKQLWANHIIVDIGDGSTIDELVLVDRVCAAMRVLLRHMDLGDTDLLHKLSSLIAKDDPNEIDITRIFAVTNEAMWTKIEEAIDSEQVHITPSEDLPSATPGRALVPMTFEIVFSDATLNEIFMVKHRMLADWRFQLTPKATWKAKWFPRKIIPWVTSAVGKTLLQFAPEAGALDARVTLRHNSETSKTLTGTVSILGSGVSLPVRLFAIQELVLILVSTAIALASGLVLYYDSNASFGSMQDYLALFTWGVGVDQGKNLAQTFQSLSSQSKSGSVVNPV